jgi:hypothetical protein
MMFSWVRLKFSQHSSYTASLKKRITDTYTGRCENIWLILKRDRKCQCHIWTSCWWRFAHFELAPDSTITNTTSSENLDATEHPLFLIVNGHHNTMVYFSLNFRNPMKLSSNIKNLEFLNLIFWFLKASGWRQLLNLKILNLILSKILKLIVEAFQNYFYKIKVSKLK